MMKKGQRWLNKYNEFKKEYERFEKESAYWAEMYIDCPDNNPEAKHYFLRNEMFWKDKMQMLINKNVKMYERLLKESAWAPLFFSSEHLLL